MLIRIGLRLTIRLRIKEGIDFRIEGFSLFYKKPQDGSNIPEFLSGMKVFYFLLKNKKYLTQYLLMVCFAKTLSDKKIICQNNKKQQKSNQKIVYKF